jgi:hypothetical protein
MFETVVMKTAPLTGKPFVSTPVIEKQFCPRRASLY